MNASKKDYLKGQYHLCTEHNSFKMRNEKQSTRTLQHSNRRHFIKKESDESSPFWPKALNAKRQGKVR